MIQLLFSPRGRINRGGFWLSYLVFFAGGILLFLLNYVLAGVPPVSGMAAGELPVQGAAAWPFFVLEMAYNALASWSGICAGIKRFHDRDKSGWWLLLILVPVIGWIWLFVETGFLRGTPGPNRFGPEPWHVWGNRLPPT